MKIDETNPYVEWLIAKKLSNNTIYLYWRYYDRFSKFDFSQVGIDKFFTDKKINNSISRAFMKSLLEFLDMSDQFKLPPKPTGKKKKRIIRKLTGDQIKSIRKVAYSENKIYGFLFDFIYYGALRRSEVAKIKINSLNWGVWFDDINKPCELMIELGKGNKDRIVLIPSLVATDFLEFYRKKANINPIDMRGFVSTLSNTTRPVFMKRNRSALDGWKVWQIIKRLSDKAIGIKIRPHEIRHARATELERNGMSIRSIQHYLGHSSPQITETYLHTTTMQSLTKVKEFMQDEI